MSTLSAHPSGQFSIGGDLVVHRLGFGAMRITGQGIWGEPADPAEAKRTLKRVPELGIDFIDTADSYGPEVSERLIHETLFPYKGLVVATKGGLTRPGPNQWVPNGEPAYLRGQVTSSLKRLCVERIDLWQLHRIDAAVPQAEQFAVIADMQKEGLIRHVGLSHIVSCGNQAGATVEEYFNYFVEDDNTKVIAAFVEGFRQPHKLLEVARKAAERTKPLIILKGGRSEVSQRAAATHSGSLAGTAEVIDAAFRQTGVVAVRSLNELMDAASVFSCERFIRSYQGGRRIGVLSPSIALIGNLNAWENISLPAAYHGSPPPRQVAEITQQVLEAFVPDPMAVLARLPDQLSTLQRRLVAFVRLLVTGPELALIDGLEQGLSREERARVARFEAEYLARQPSGTLVYVDAREEQP